MILSLSLPCIPLCRGTAVHGINLCSPILFVHGPESESDEFYFTTWRPFLREIRGKKRVPEHHGREIASPISPPAGGRAGFDLS
jgi:hypothetical protein